MHKQSLEGSNQVRLRRPSSWLHWGYERLSPFPENLVETFKSLETQGSQLGGPLLSFTHTPLSPGPRGIQHPPSALSAVSSRGLLENPSSEREGARGTPSPVDILGQGARTDRTSHFAASLFVVKGQTPSWEKYLFVFTLSKDFDSFVKGVETCGFTSRRVMACTSPAASAQSLQSAMNFYKHEGKMQSHFSAFPNWR